MVLPIMMSLKLPWLASPIVPVQRWLGLMARSTVMDWVDWTIDPLSVRLDEAFASATVFASTWAAVRAANGSAVLLALAAALAPALALEVVLLPQATAARQLTPAAATNVIRTNTGRPSNIIFSHQNVTSLHRL